MIEKIGLIDKIKDRKIEQRNPNIFDVVDRYDLSEKEKYAIDEFDRRIDTYMEIYHGVKPGEDSEKYVSSTETFQKAMKVATIVPLIVGGVYALRKHFMKTVALTIGTAMLSRVAERKFGTITRYLQTHDPVSLCARIGVYNSERNLKRVIAHEKRLRLN